MIRPAEIKDLEQILDLAEEFYNQSDMASCCAFNRVSTSFLMKELIDNERAVLLVDDHDGIIYGGIGGQLMPMTYNFDKCGLFENFWFISEVHRGRSNPLKLVSAFQQFAVENGAVIIMMGAYHHLTFDQISKIYIKRGFKATETIFMKEV